MSDHDPLVILGETQSYETGVVEAFLAGATYFMRLSDTTTKFWRVREGDLEYSLLTNASGGSAWKLEAWYPCEKEIPNNVSLL